MDFFEKITSNVFTGIIGGSITSLFIKGTLSKIEIGLIIGSAVAITIIYKVTKKRNQGINI